MRTIKFSRQRCPSPSGSRIRVEKMYDVENDCLVDVGTIDQQEVIQSYEHEASISTILAKATHGDLSGLRRAQGVFADLSGLPQDPTTAQLLRADANRYFESLPADVRALYHNDLDRFFEAIKSVNGQAQESNQGDVKDES